MTQINFHAPAELFLGSDRATALAQGPRAFRTAAQALRFAHEHAAPVSLRGASLRVDGRTFDRSAMHQFYQSDDYPLGRPVAATPRRKRRLPFYGATFASAA